MILYTGSDTYYSSSEVVGEALEVDKAQHKVTGTLAWAPIIKGTVRIPVQYKKDENSVIGEVVDTPKDGTLILRDPLTHEKIEDPTLTTGTIDYESGAIEIDLTGLENNSQTLANYRYNNMSIGDGAIGTNALQVPEVDIKIDTLPVVTQSRKLKALYAFDAAFTLQKEYGADINALLNSQIASEIAHEIDGEIMNDLLRGAGLVNSAWNRERPMIELVA